MNLNPEEYKLIEQRMLGYKITYQEIYHEILDHVASGIERKRDNGDMRAVTVVLDELIIELGGAQGIRNMSRNQERLYQLKIHQRVWKAYGHHIWGKILLSAVLTILIARLLPVGVNYTMGVYMMVFITLIGAGIYAMVRMRVIKKTNKKRSLVKTYIRLQVFSPLIYLNLVFTIPNVISWFTNINARAFMRGHPTIPLVLFFFIVFFIASCYKVMQEEMKASKI